MKNNLVLFLSFAFCFASCKKGNDTITPTPVPVGQLQLPHGNPIGNIISKEIGPAGGSIQSEDGVMQVTIPAGAVDAPVMFSIQEVENTLETRGRSYRLKPEQTVFKKPVVLTYKYGSLDFGIVDPKYFFLACQDEEGYYFSASKTKHNKANNTLTVETTHFSDWTFYSMYEFEVTKGALINGKIILGEDEEAALYIKCLKSKPKASADDNIDDLLTPILNPTISAAGWDLLPREGMLNVAQNSGSATYRAPNVIVSTHDIVVTAMMTGDLGKDNEGNPVRQIQLSQPITLVVNDYFIVSEDGQETRASDMSGDLIQLFGTQLNARFPDGTNLSCYIYETGIGGFAYNEHGKPGTATLEMVPSDGKAYIVYRPNPCNPSGPGQGELAFSPGTFNLTSVAHSPGQYFEGNFTVTLFRFDWCDSRETRSLSGRFRIRKKV